MMKWNLTKPLENLLPGLKLRGLSHLLMLIGLLMTGLFSLQAATQLEEGWQQDFTFPATISEPTGGKGSENKLWFNDGFWWGMLWSNSGNAYHIHRLDESSQDWLDTGTVADDRDDSRSDTLWDETSQKLYVVSHRYINNSGQAAAAGDRGELYRYSYNAGSDSYTLDSGFPVEVNAARGETLVLEKDSTGRLWVTYTRDQTVYVNHSGSSDTDWDPENRPFILPTGDTTVDITTDDISSITSFGNNIGVLWSNQSDEKMYFSVHADSASPTSGWSSGIVVFGAGINPADDHINLASLDGNPAGVVFAVTKTSETNARNMLLICSSGCTSANDWDAYTAYQAGSGTDNPTRASVVIDTTNNELYVFTTATVSGEKDIYYKVTDLDNIQFNATDTGIPLIKDSSHTLNNVTSTKQNLNEFTGLAVLAASSNRYVHNRFALATNFQDIAVLPASHGYGDVLVGSSNVFGFEVRNDGSVDLHVSATTLVGADPGEFNIDSGGGAFTLTPGSSQNIMVSFNPGSLGSKSASLSISSDDPDENPFNVLLLGKGTDTIQLHNEEVQTGSSSATTTVATSGNVTAASGDLYLAAITSKSFKTVTSVSGLGLTWTQLDSQCGGRNQTGVNLWKAIGSPSVSGPVTATLSGAPSNAAIAVSRYSGVDGSNPIGTIVSGNSNGVDGGCSGGVDASAYSVNLSTSASGSVVVGVIAMRNRSHTPGAGYTEQVEFITPGGGGDATSVASMDRRIASPSSVAVNGTFSNNVDYAVIGVEIRSGADGGGPVAPVLSKSFGPGLITVGGISTLTLTIDNSANAVALNALALVDTYPAAINNARTLNITNTCGGTVTAFAGTASLELSGGTVAAGGSCIVAVDVTSLTLGSHLNTTGAVGSTEAPNSAVAMDSLTVSSAPVAPGLSKSFGPNPITAGGISTLTLTIDNSANAVALNGLSLVDNYPVAINNGATPNVTNSCGGTVTALAGAASVSLSGGSVAAGGSCTVTVNVTSLTPGGHLNTSGVVSSSEAPDSAVAMDNLTVTASGGGGNVTFEEIQTGGSSGLASLTTAGSLSAVSGDLYLAAITSKNFTTVTSVTGLGLNWTQLDTQCGGRNQTGVNVWKAQGNPNSSGAVTATLSGAPNNAAIAVSRYSGVDASNPIGTIVSGNSNGVDGGCSGGVDASAYNVNLTTTTSGSVVVGAIAMRNRSHTPGAGYTERVEFITPGGGSNATSVASMDRTIASPSSVVVDGTFSNNVDYAVIAIEIKPDSNPGPDISLSPTSHDYQNVALGGSASASFGVSNNGNVDLNVTATSLIGSDAAEFSIDNGGGAFSLAPGQMQVIEISYNPTTLGFKSITLRINSDDPDEEPFDLPLSGSGVISAPDISLSPTSHDYGDVLIGSGSASFNFAVSNDGSIDLNVSATSLIGSAAGEFSIDNGGGGFSLAPGQTRIIEVSYHPTSPGLKSITLRINSNDPDEEPFDVTLTGSGVNTLPDITLEAVVGGGSSSSASVATSGTVTAISGDLYLAAITSKPFKTITSVTGLGLSWSPVDAQCGGRNQTGVNLWMAQGSPSGSGPVNASFSETPSNASIAVSRYSGVNQTNPIGNSISGNSNGIDGSCSGGTDGNVYSVNLSTTASGSVVVGAIAMRNRSHNPGVGYTEQLEIITPATGGGNAASVAIMDQTVSSPTAVTVNGAFSGNVDYAVIGVEIKP